MLERELLESNRKLLKAGQNYKKILEELSLMLAIYNYLLDDFSSRYELSLEEKRELKKLKQKARKMEKKKKAYEKHYHKMMGQK